MGATFSECVFQGSITPALLSLYMIESSLLHDAVLSIFNTGGKQIQKHQVKLCLLTI